MKKRQLPPLQGCPETGHPQQVAEAVFSFYRACYSGSSVSEPPGDQHRMNARPRASGSAGRGNRASMTAIRWVVCSGSSGSLLAPALSLSPSDPILRSASATGACAGTCKGKSQDAQIRRSCPPLPGPSAPQLRRTGAAAEEAPHCPLLLYRGWTPIRASPVSGGTGDAVLLPPSRSRSRRPALRP